MTIWKCTVCGYLHRGAAPPAECPVCHAGSEAFVVEPAAGSAFDLFGDLVSGMVAHAIAAHFPNALTPLLVLASGLGVLALAGPFDETVLLLLLALAVTAPLAYVTGIRDWRRHYGGVQLPLFRWKLGLGAGLIVCSLLAIGLRLGAPQFAAAPAGRWLLLGLQGGMLVAATGLGHLGGKLVFSRRVR